MIVAPVQSWQGVLTSPVVAVRTVQWQFLLLLQVKAGAWFALVATACLLLSLFAVGRLLHTSASAFADALTAGAPIFNLDLPSVWRGVVGYKNSITVFSAKSTLPKMTGLDPMHGEHPYGQLITGTRRVGHPQLRFKGDMHGIFGTLCDGWNMVIPADVDGALKAMRIEDVEMVLWPGPGFAYRD